MKRLLAGLLLLLLSACAAANGPRPVAVDAESLVAQIRQLPGAVLRENPLQFSYPEQAMFGVGAVLPLPGGTGTLNPLADFFLRNAGLVWQVEVPVQTEHGSEYDQALAEKRSELLASYLLYKKVDLSTLHFQPEAAAGEPLVFTLQTPITDGKAKGSEK